jgi:hypothetical protein
MAWAMAGLSASVAAAKARGAIAAPSWWVPGTSNTLDGGLQYTCMQQPFSPFRRAKYSPSEAESDDGKTVALVRAREGARAPLLTLPTPPFMVAKLCRYTPR